MNYAREVPLSKNEQKYDSAPPAFISNQSQMGNPVASSVITFNDKTTVLEVSAIGGASGAAAAGIIMKWGSASVTSSNFDNFVLAGTTRQFVIPVSVFGTTSIAGANVANGLYATVAVKHATAVAASIITTEY